MFAFVVVIATALGAHNASQGTCAFVVHENGKVTVHIELLETDLPELCDVELNQASPLRRQAAKDKLEACVARDFPAWLRLRIGTASCQVLAGRYRHGAGLQVELEADALCVEPQGRTLTLDWGLFQSSSLDHQTTSTLTLPDGSIRRALLSKRHNRWSVEVPDPRVELAKTIALALAVAAAAAVAVAFFRRRRQPR